MRLATGLLLQAVRGEEERGTKETKGSTGEIIWREIWKSERVRVRERKRKSKRGLRQGAREALSFICSKLKSTFRRLPNLLQDQDAPEHDPEPDSQVVQQLKVW